jgi:hypothetical protein
MLLEKPDESSEVIIVSVAQHQRIEPRGVDTEQLGVINERFGSKSKVHERAADLGAAARFSVHSQTELADECAAGGGLSV